MVLLSALDDDLLQHCLALLDWHDLVTCSAVCHRFNRSASSNLLWQPLVQQFPQGPPADTHTLTVPEGVWRHVFKGWLCARTLTEASSRVLELRELEKRCANRSRFLRHSVRLAVQRVEGVKTILREKRRQRESLMALDALSRMDQVRAARAGPRSRVARCICSREASPACDRSRALGGKIGESTARARRRRSPRSTRPRARSRTSRCTCATRSAAWPP